MSAGLACNYSSSHQLVMSSRVETSLIVTVRDSSTSLGMREMEQFNVVDLASRPRKKTGTRFLSAILFRRTILRFLSLLLAYDRVVGEVQVVGSSAIDVDPPLDRIVVSRIERHRQRDG